MLQHDGVVSAWKGRNRTGKSAWVGKGLRFCACLWKEPTHPKGTVIWKCLDRSEATPGVQLLIFLFRWIKDTFKLFDCKRQEFVEKTMAVCSTGWSSHETRIRPTNEAALRIAIALPEKWYGRVPPCPRHPVPVFKIWQDLQVSCQPKCWMRFQQRAVNFSKLCKLSVRQRGGQGKLFLPICAICRDGRFGVFCRLIVRLFEIESDSQLQKDFFSEVVTVVLLCLHIVRTSASGKELLCKFCSYIQALKFLCRFLCKQKRWHFLPKPLFVVSWGSTLPNPFWWGIILKYSPANFCWVDVWRDISFEIMKRSMKYSYFAAPFEPEFSLWWRPLGTATKTVSWRVDLSTTAVGFRGVCKESVLGTHHQPDFCPS